jgi:oligopeptide transport system substrate-binding protein
VSRSRLWRLIAVLAALTMIAVACGDDDDDDDAGTDSTAGGETTDTGATADTGATDDTGTETSEGATGAPGGELIDLGTFVGDPPEHIDPALNSTLDAYQVINALYDGLTEIDSSDPDNPVVVPLVAETVTPNDDASVWTFVIRENAQFSNGEPILPSSFVRAWERASDPDFAGDYSYLFNFIEGGAEKLAGEAETISGVEADDETRTLTVTLSAPYSGFAAVSGFQLFFPMPSAVEELSDQLEWENGVMIGNGPYMLESPRSDQEIIVVRNDNWQGDIYGNTVATLDRITFRTSADPDTAYNAFEAGEGDTANIPPGRVTEADENYATTLDVAIAGVYYFDLNVESPLVGGPENVLLRQAISQAIDREQINQAVYDGSRSAATGVTPPGIPGYVPDLCDFCTYDVDAAQAAFDEWTAAGNTLAEPIPIQFNTGAGHENVVQIIIANLEAIGIPAVADGRETETYFSSLADGECVFCRAGWFADYPTYDNFMYDLFHSDAIGGNNYSQFNNPDFDALVDEAKANPDPAAAGELFNEAEDILLNQDIAVVPINFYRGDYVYNPERITGGFTQSSLGLIPWETVTVAD